MSSVTSESISQELQILPVSGRKMTEEFIQLAWTINQSDPMWVPPLKSEVRNFLNPKVHPIYEFGFAQPFIAYRNGKPVGRILASDDPKLNERKQTNTGTWGMFECINDVSVAHALLQTSFEWSHSKFGRKSIIGPMNYSTNYEMGLLIRGFDTPPRVGMNHNPQYYEQLVKDAGAVECQGLYAWWFDSKNIDLLDKWKKRVDWFSNRTHFNLRTFDQKHFEQEILYCREVYNASMRDNWSYAELTRREIDLFAKQLVHFADPKHIFLAFDGEKPIGFSITVPDLNQVLCHLNGKLFPLGIFKYLYWRKKVKGARMMVLCIDPSYRRRGISELLIFKTLEYGLSVGYTSAELGWTYRDNVAVNTIIERIGCIPYKEYGMYEFDGM